jgi:hypothetical protein
MKIVGGNASSAEKKNFLSALYYSQHFYQRVVLRIGQIESDTDGSSLSLLSNIQIQSDEQILSDLNLHKSSPVFTKKTADDQQIIWFWQKVKAFFNPVSSGRKRWVYATVSIAVLIIVSFAGVHYYNTTYQIMMAEDLLKENYRVYMAGAPRPSGNYGSTGVAKLMNNDEDLSYLYKAEIHLNKAQNNGARADEIQILKARIKMFNNNLAGAESIYKQMPESLKNETQVLNDIGVLYFKLNEFQDAKSSFQKALQSDDNFLEAKYNLALTEEKLGHKKKALLIMKQILLIETDPGWKNAAETFIDNLQN